MSIQTLCLPAPTTLEDLAALDTGICGEPFQAFTVPVPLDRLLLSGLNVRQTERDADIASLAEDIFASGLKQNLVVIPAHFVTTGENRDHTGLFEVVAGGRRVQALQLLAADGRLPVDHPVLCRIEPRETATESSLSENLHRVAMNPADEFTAFSKIVADTERTGQLRDGAIAGCAKRFGVTVRHVEQRLRLAALAPDILAALREGKITLDSAKAYAGTTDHELQLKVFAQQEKSNWQKHAASIVRDALRQRSLSLNDRLVKFVGLDAYRAAGGRTETDMFMGTEGEERLLDVQLLGKLARDRAEPLVAPRAKKDGFAGGMLATPGSDKWPAAPDGMERYNSYYHDKAPTKAELKKCVAVYGIDESGIEKLGHFHTPKPAAPREERDWAAERRVRDREWAIETNAARMAAPKFAGTPLEGILFWPSYQARLVDQDPDDENFALVSVLIRVPAADIAAHRAEAARVYDEAVAAKEAEQAAAPAEADA